jgi:hypothetical protein
MSQVGNKDLSSTQTIDGAAKLHELAQVEPGAGPVISVYLDTRWTDEHQRERVRVFCKNERRKVAAMAAGQLAADLAWIEDQAGRLVALELHPEATGVALFASEARGLRSIIPLAAVVTDTFTVADVPRLRPLVDALAAAPRGVVLFVDGARARFVPFGDEGPGDEVTLEHTDVVGHHRRGGWAMLLQSRYQRHIHVHRARHFDAVAAVLADVVAAHPAVVLAGESRNLAVFQDLLPPSLAGRVAGTIAATGHEPASVLAREARALIRHAHGSAQDATLDTVLVDAEAGGRGAAGVDTVVEAVNRSTVDRLYLLRPFEEAGWACSRCGALQRGEGKACRWCSGETSPVELGEAMVHRVLVAGGTVESVALHAGLARAGGVAALRRYAAP